MKRSDVIKLIISCTVPLAVGYGGSFWTANSMDWYQTLAKPAFNPPGWIFAPVWTMLYLLMGIAVFLVWQRGLADKAGKVALATFILQLVFNALWMPIFFGMKQPLIAFGVVILLWLAIAGTIICFYRVNKLSAILLLPYIIWVSFAAVLNASICVLNQ
ncbi:MAG: TspO/MBR family protein [Sedimentisphaerales bacterium]